MTVAIPVRNDASNLRKCLPRLLAFQHIFVIDSASSDDTRQIAEAHGARVLDFAWNGKFPKKRNWFLQNTQLNTEWILFLDADEFVDARFCDEVRTEISNTGKVGFWLNYTNHFLGQPLKFGVPQRKLALFRADAGEYERIDEDHWSGLDMEVHEHPVLVGETGEISSPIDHDEDRGLAKFIDRHAQYAAWEARRWALLNTPWTSASGPSLTQRQHFKYRHVQRWWYPAFYFLYAYIMRLGFLDGRAGFAYAVLKSWYFYLIRLMIHEHRDQLPR